jgi:carbamoyl-phosphate synthase small subunit
MATAKKPAKAPTMAKAKSRPQFGDWDVPRVTGLLVLADGTVIEGQGFGAEGDAVGEVCFNTAMTGYQEVLTDPSYAGQIVTFTFPHIGNVGTNDEDIETTNLAASAGVRRLHRQGADHGARQLPRRQAFRQVAEVPQHRRPLRR